MDSILETVKNHNNVIDTFFDAQLIDYINSAFFTLNQLGVGPDEVFSITDSSAVWEDFKVNGTLEMVRSYVSLYVKLLFDPPSNSYLVDNITKTLREQEFRLMVECEKTRAPEADMTGIYYDDV